MQGTGVALLIPIIIALIYGEYYTIPGFLVGSTISLILGSACRYGIKEINKIRLKHGMIISSLAWIWASLMGSITMMIIIPNISLLNAFFENMSAFSGTGITLFANVEILPYSLLFLRSLEQWLGGLGIVVIVIGILIRAGTAASKLYKSEARDERIKPSVKNTLHKSTQIYGIYTIIGIILYLLAGMPLFDSICNTFTTIATGGMAIKNSSIGYYHNPIINYITIFLMLLGATSFMAHYKVYKTKGKAIFKDIQFQAMILIIILTSFFIGLLTNIMPMEIAFHIISAITTTGASLSSSITIAHWPDIFLVILMIVMIIGGSSGSTTGGVKIIRIITFLKGIYINIMETISPEGRVMTMKISGKEIPERAIKESASYILLFLGMILISWMVLLYYGYDGFYSLFEVISAQANIGLSTGIISNNLQPFAKIMIIINMWTGRLEIIPVLVTLRSFLELFKSNKIVKTKPKKRNIK